MNTDLIRRSFGFVLTIAASITIGWLLKGHGWLRHDLVRPAALGAIILMVIAIGVLFWAAVRHSFWKTILAFLIGIGAYWWFDQEFHPKFLYFAGGLLALIVLYAITVVDDGLIRRRTDAWEATRPQRANP